MRRNLALITIFAFLILIVSCKRDVIPDSVVSSQQNILLYSRYNENGQVVIVQQDVTDRVMRQWIARQDVDYPSRSPDGTQVAYFVYEGTEVFSLWVADNLGQNARKIGGPYPFYAGNMGAEWSFDARYLAFRVSPDPNQAFVYIVDATTDGEVEIIPGWDFAWSHQNNQLAVYTGSLIQIWDIENRLSQDLLDVYVPNPNNGLAWLVSQQTVVFLADLRQQIMGIYSVDVVDKRVHLLLPDDPDLAYRSLCCLQVSPNGKYIAFLMNSQSLSGVVGIANLMVLDVDSAEVFAVDGDISGPIVWSPDSRYIAYGNLTDETGEPIGSWDLFLFSLDQRSVTRLTYDRAAPTGLTW